jgi:hypothetical protein
MERIERIEHLKRELTHLNKFELENLVEKSKQLQPFKLRRQKIRPPFNKCKCLIDYNREGFLIPRDEECLIEDNTLRVKWKVSTRSDPQTMHTAPSVIFMIPLVDEESFDSAADLRAQCENLICQAQSCQIQYRKDRLLSQMNRIKFYEIECFEDEARRYNDIIEFEGLIIQIKLDIDGIVSDLAEKVNRAEESGVGASPHASVFGSDVSLLLESYDVCCAKLDELSEQFKLKSKWEIWSNF